MRDMDCDHWDVQQTEEGLQEVLRRLAECRAAGDQVGIGYALLNLSFLVKWVRSDTDQAPFERSHELALEALEVFRSVDEPRGLVRSLIAASPLAAPEVRESFLSEAEQIAWELGDENQIAAVLAARARSLALYDRSAATKLHERVLKTFESTGNQRGKAQTLFALAIGSGTASEKLEFAREAAHLYRELGDPAQASRCMSVALLNAEEIHPIGELRELAKAGLADALTAGDRLQERHFYEKLAQISKANGDEALVEQYGRWAKDLEDSDGLSPLERRELDVQMGKWLASYARAQGLEDADEFEAELGRLDEPETEP